MVASEVLDRRALNRALLARQLLLDRGRLGVADAIEWLVGMQSQAPHPPYVGLWTRVAGFQPEDLSRLLHERAVVRIALLRSTLHLVSARDALALRPLLQPVIARGLGGANGRELAGVDLAELADVARALVDEAPRTFAELGALLGERWPDRRGDTLAVAVRALLPLVQVTPRGIWGTNGPVAHTTAERWLGRPLAPAAAPDTVVRRYLAAFGPATVADMQKWSGLTRLRSIFDSLPDLVSFRDERGRLLYDLPDAPRPHPETPAPVRFLPEWDNALMAHADRGRILADGHAPQVFTGNGIILGTVLVDGFVAATWRMARHRGGATLLVEPLRPLSTTDTRELAGEGARLLAFAAAGADRHDIEVAQSKWTPYPQAT